MALHTTITHHQPMKILFILDKEKLGHSNFLDWHRKLTIILKQENKDYVLENYSSQRTITYS